MVISFGVTIEQIGTDTKLVTSTVVRKDVAILIGNEGDNREIQQFQRANDEEVFLRQPWLNC